MFARARSTAPGYMGDIAMRLFRRSNWYCASFAFTVIAGFAQPALAQDDQPVAAEGDDALNTVYVTANRRSENLQDVPISAATLEADQVRTIFDAGAEKPHGAENSALKNTAPLSFTPLRISEKASIGSSGVPAMFSGRTVRDGSSVSGGSPENTSSFTSAP